MPRCTAHIFAFELQDEENETPYKGDTSDQACDEHKAALVIRVPSRNESSDIEAVFCSWSGKQATNELENWRLQSTEWRL